MNTPNGFDIYGVMAAVIIGMLLGAGGVIFAISPRVQRLEDWAWGPNRKNGTDWQVKRAHERLDRMQAHERMQDARNVRQHPGDQNRGMDEEAG